MTSRMLGILDVRKGMAYSTNFGSTRIRFVTVNLVRFLGHFEITSTLQVLEYTELVPLILSYKF